MTIESLMQQTGAFVDTLTIKPAATDKTEAKTAMEARVPEQGDRVDISEEGRALVAVEESGDSEKSKDSKVSIAAEQPEESEEESEIDRIIRMLKEQITRIKEEIKELENSDLPEKMKQTMIQDKQVMLMDLNDQLADALEKKMNNIGGTVSGGTPAKQFGNTAKTF